MANGESYDIAFVADNPGIWMDHCHNLRHAAEGRNEPGRRPTDTLEVFDEPQPCAKQRGRRALGSFAVAAGWAGLSTRTLPRWLSWWIVIAGLCLVAARAVWTTPAWFIGYALFWLWLIVLSVRFLQRAAMGRRVSGS